MFGRAECHHQWHQVILARVGQARVRRLAPVQQRGAAFGRRQLAQHVLQPGVECVRRLLAAGPELAQVVVAEAAADDQDAFAAQRIETGT